jgi:hypothetical protein
VSTGFYDLAMVDWLTFHAALSGPCHLCRVRRVDHDGDEMGHEWRDPSPPSTTEQETNTRIRMNMREIRGDYAAPLPPPEERRRIREAAEWTQEQVADALRCSRQAVSSYEIPVNWKQDPRHRGREPSKELRAEYSTLLRKLEARGL